MKSSIILLFVLSVLSLSSCNYQEKKNNALIKKNSKNIKTEDVKEYIGTWLFVEKRQNNEFRYCTDISKSIIATNSAIHAETPMEDSDFKIDHIKEKDGITYIYLDKKELSSYKFKWIDKENGISEWTLDNYQTDIYVSKLKLNKIKKSKCEQEETIKGFVCEISNLSSKFNFKIVGTDFENKEKNLNPLIAKILIAPKRDPSLIQEVRFEPSSWVLFSDVPCNAISYFKKEKSINESIENHHDFIVADYNFDGLEDFAYIWDIGGNGGALFSYFFQNNKGEFSESDSFPLQNGLFPSEINIERKTLTTVSPVGCCKMNKMTYQLKNNKWELTQSKQEDLK